MKIKLGLAILLFMIFNATTVLAELAIEAEVDKTDISLSQTLTYKVTITSTDKALPAPQFPKFKSFSIVSQAQSSQLSFVKSDFKRILVYTFVLAPVEVGRFKLEPTLIKIKDKSYSTEVFEIEVTKAKTEPKTPPQKKPSFPPEPQRKSGQPQFTL